MFSELHEYGEGGRIKKIYGEFTHISKQKESCVFGLNKPM